MKKNKPSFEQLVRENKQKLLNDQRALDELEERLEKKLEKRFLEKLS
ncbi:FbpB family small basic protein [Bacillus sp. FJAT-47783]|nr:FbpB family small basic protein [Bacillus sp. FJAT-47783]